MTSRFQGLIPPIVTPLADSGAIDEDSLRSLIDFQIAAGVDGLFVLGSSGEAIYLDDAARRRVVEIAVDAVAGRVVLLVGALDASAGRVVDQVRWIDQVNADAVRAGRSGVDGIVVTAPFYANMADEEVGRHFELVAATTDLPILAYDIPGNVGKRLPLSVLIDLLQRGVIAGLKDSSGSLTEFRRALDALGPDRSVALLTGADVVADLALDLGADGLIPGLANVRPDLFVSLLSAHATGDGPRVAAYQRAITDLTDIFGVGQRFGLGRHASELGALKYLLREQGVIATTAVSAPLTPYSADGLAVVQRIADELQARLERELASLQVSA